LYTVGAIRDCPLDSLASVINAGYSDIFVLNQLLPDFWEVRKKFQRKLAPWVGQSARRYHHSGTNDPTSIDCIPQRHVAVPTRVSKIADGRDTCLKVFSAHRCPQQRALGGAHVVANVVATFLYLVVVYEQMRVTVD